MSRLYVTHSFFGSKPNSHHDKKDNRGNNHTDDALFGNKNTDGHNRRRSQNRKQQKHGLNRFHETPLPHLLFSFFSLQENIPLFYPLYDIINEQFMDRS